MWSSSQSRKACGAGLGWLLSQRPPAKPEAWKRWSGSKPLGSVQRWLRIRSMGALRTSASHANRVLWRAPLCRQPQAHVFPANRLVTMSDPSRSGRRSLRRLIPGIVKLWEHPRQSRGVSHSSSSPRLTIPCALRLGSRRAQPTCCLKTLGLLLRPIGRPDHHNAANRVRN